jgi:nitrite reductase (NO-forming)
MNLYKLSVALVIAFVVCSVAAIGAIFLLGGTELLGYLRVNLIQAFGLGTAVTASLFFFLRLVWKLHALPMEISMVFFIVGVAMFVSVSFGSLYTFQYPVFVNSFGPGMGPGLPLANVITFFRHINSFERVGNIARNPNEVPSPITVKREEEVASVAATSSATSTDAQSATSSEPAAIAAERAPEVVKVYLETKEVLSEVGPDIVFNYWTFNGQVPGPFVRVREGDTVEVTIHNDETSLHSHNVDFHAATGPGGGGAVSVVAPGETKTFSFKAMDPGLFVYHCAVPNMAVHMTHGMYGLILVEPKDGLPAVDKEFYVMQGELYTTGKLGRTGLQVFDAQKMLDGKPEYVVFNGKTGGLGTNMEAKVGDRIRMYVGNGGVSSVSSFHVVGEVFDTVYPEGSLGGTLFKDVQTTVIPAGGATIVEFTADYPGKYTLVDHALMRADKGAWGTLTVTGEADPSIFNGDFSMPMNSGH